MNVIAPWVLGMGVLVSFTAVAGQDPAVDRISPILPKNSGPAAPAALLAAPLEAPNPALLQSAKLAIGEMDDLRAIPDESEPHVELKPGANGFPDVDRTRKGDPIVAMRPSFESRKGAPAGLGFVESAMSSIGESTIGAARNGPAKTAVSPRFPVLPAPAAPGPLALLPDFAPRAEAPADAAPNVAKPAPVAVAPEPATTQKATAAASPSQTSGAATPIDEAQLERAAHGATPKVSRAIRLGSTTPAQPDAMPIEVASFPRATFALAAPEKSAATGPRPDYVALLDPEKMDREKRCLAEAVYFESRSEPEDGQAAVAQVVLNRVASGLYPGNVCGVVYQNRSHFKRCQFSFACEGKSLRITERAAWESAVRVANSVMEGATYLSEVGRATHYHATYVKPRWAKALTKTDAIGKHIFYKLKPGQT